MQETNVVPKETSSIEDSIDSFLDKTPGYGVPADRTPANTPSVAKEEDGSDPVKTPSTPSAEGDKPTGQELGPVPYDKFQKAIHERQEAEKALKAKVEELQGLSVLLDDPDIFKRYLKRQGYSDFEIRQEMQKRGMTAEESGQKKAIAERVLERLYGENVKSMKPEDINAIREHMGLIEAVTREIMGEEIQPIKGFVNQRERETQVDSELNEAESMAKEDGIEFEKEAIPAMQMVLEELQKANPSFRKNPPSAMFLYEKAAKRILRDRLQSKGRQDVRDEKKGNAKPLIASSPVSSPKEKRSFKSERELDDEIDKKLDELGFRG